MLRRTRQPMALRQIDTDSPSWGSTRGLASTNIACTHIRAARPGQKLKTASLERLVPIHSKLLALGSLEYVAKVKEVGNERVLTELGRGGGRLISIYFVSSAEIDSQP